MGEARDARRVRRLTSHHDPSAFCSQPDRDAARRQRDERSREPSASATGCCCGSTTPTWRATSRAARRRSSTTSRWLGIDWDDGPVRQSDRAERHLEAARAAGLPQRFEGVMLWRDEGPPTFHLASVVDDIDFEITHVIRGSDHRANEELHAALHARARVDAAARHPPRARRRRRREEALEARAGSDGRVAARGRLPGRGGARVPRGARPAAARRAPRSRPHPLAVGRRARRSSTTRRWPNGSACRSRRRRSCAALTTSSRRGRSRGRCSTRRRDAAVGSEPGDARAVRRAAVDAAGRARHRTRRRPSSAS